MLQAQQRLSGEPEKTLLSAGVRESICSRGGFFASVRGWRWEMEQPAFPRCQLALCSLWRHKWELCSAPEMPPSASWGLSLQTPPEIHHRRLVCEGFGEQVRQMCHRWLFGDGMGLDDLSHFFSTLFSAALQSVF